MIEWQVVGVTRPIVHVQIIGSQCRSATRDRGLTSSKEDTVKLCIMSVLFTAALGFVGCVSTSEPSDPSPRQTSEAQVDDQSAAGPDDTVEVAASCSSAGGVCRKSVCRTGEVLNNRLECGTDAACCVPVP